MCIRDRYIAIIGDIKDSKKLNDRKKIQEKLQKVLNEVNQKYYEDISSNFMITLGDEFQEMCIRDRVWGTGLKFNRIDEDLSGLQLTV